MKLLGTGLSGMVGSFVKQELPSFEFHNLDLAEGVDITNPDQVRSAVESSESEVLLHFAAFTDLNRAWEEKNDKSGVCWKVNVEGTRNIVQAVKETGKYLIHISTAYVFDGEKQEAYLESDQPNPIDWYGVTKHEAEKIVTEQLQNAIIIRLDQPFRPDRFEGKPDHVRKIINTLREGGSVHMFADTLFSPSYIGDLPMVIDWAIQNKPTGIYHFTTGTTLSHFQFAKSIQQRFSLSGEVIESSLKEYLVKSAQENKRPYLKNSALNSNKLNAELGQKLHGFEDALSLLTL